MGRTNAALGQAEEQQKNTAESEKRKARFRLKYSLAQAYKDRGIKCAKSNKHPLVSKTI